MIQPKSTSNAHSPSPSLPREIRKQQKTNHYPFLSFFRFYSIFTFIHPCQFSYRYHELCLSPISLFHTSWCLSTTFCITDWPIGPPSNPLPSLLCMFFLLCLVFHGLGRMANSLPFIFFSFPAATFGSKTRLLDLHIAASDNDKGFCSVEAWIQHEGNCHLAVLFLPRTSGPLQRHPSPNTLHRVHGGLLHRTHHGRSEIKSTHLPTKLYLY